MRTWKLPLLAVLAVMAAPATASAAFMHVIAPGETLSSVAAADGLSVAELAAANGLSSDAELVAGSTIAIPPQTAGVSAPSAEPASAPASAPTSSASGGGYVVQPGDTLSSIAARFGVSMSALASANGLDPAGLLLAGSTLSVSGGGYEPAAAPSSSSTGASGSSGGADPTSETVSPTDVGDIASAEGVSPSFAEAIADQESGFNNNEVSPTGATGVMQIEPGTWNDINTLDGSLSPSSAGDNVRGGVLLLRSLLDQTGGSAAQAAAAYYQGLASVREHGMYSDTQSYVNNVLALQQRFGG